jgi:hypothetical protein
MISSTLIVIAAMWLGPPAAPLHIALAFDTGVSSAMEETVVEEAARVWAPYGVALDTTPAGPGSITVRVSVVGRPLPGVNGRALGSIPFELANPEPVISLYAETAADLLADAATAGGAHWPPAYRDLMLGRVLGRALAHEIGHYLLRSRGHSQTGLMRATQSIVDLMQAYDGRLVLLPDQQAALSRALAGR